MIDDYDPPPPPKPPRVVYGLVAVGLLLAVGSIAADGTPKWILLAAEIVAVTAAGAITARYVRASRRWRHELNAWVAGQP